MHVFVLHKDGHPLMPTTPGKARKMLKQKNAKITSYEPFVIQLTYETTTYTQDITLGVDAGSKTIGLSAATEMHELFTAEVHLRQDVSKNIEARKMFRRNRRSRKTRYRKARFLNRVKRKKKGWLAPSVKHKIASHEHIIDRVHRLLPVSRIIVETAAFDTQLLENPDIAGTDYQQGARFGFFNTREYVLFRGHHTCQLCKGKSNDSVLNVHHLVYRSRGGSDRPSNLLTLCNTCHSTDNHKPGRILWEWCMEQKKAGNYRHAAFMGIMRKTLLARLRLTYQDVQETYGYLTKSKRIEKNYAKSHSIDALMISGKINAKPTTRLVVYRKVRKHNRQLHKATIQKGGVRKRNQAAFEVYGFRLFDKVKINNTLGFITGRRTSGYFAVKDIHNNWLHKSASWKNCQLLERRPNYTKSEVNRVVSSPL